MTVGVSRSWSTLVTNPAAAMPSNLIFLTGGNPGSIIIGGGAVTVVASAYTAANGYYPLAPWAGFAVLCGYTAVVLGLARILVGRAVRNL